MNYEKIYNNLINTARETSIPHGVYKERHHITEPFSVVSIDTAAEALAAATALVDQGVRMGQILNLQTRLRPSKIFRANDELSLEDFLSGIDLDVVLELPAFSWDEASDTGTLTYDCTFAEED